MNFIDHQIAKLKAAVAEQTTTFTYSGVISCLAIKFACQNCQFGSSIFLENTTSTEAVQASQSIHAIPLTKRPGATTMPTYDTSSSISEHDLIAAALPTWRQEAVAAGTLCNESIFTSSDCHGTVISTHDSLLPPAETN